ncbi:DUF2787 domain-containing protein [Vibrio sp. ZSDZ65]|uniref:DUF2787 domain-containing protein n=1 Tax=Vibrio qingdaonensis TaxID=2829491 RepID=A0A9X3HYZ8_9VIBR|nr:DUF2787 domain-containing protein [Vibrio qingdaonensis]MCW8349325.1 DUF2787 domain-containing protein [Vibrio qingdaonensis]
MSKQLLIRSQIGFLTTNIKASLLPVSDALTHSIVTTLAHRLTQDDELADSLVDADGIIFNFRDASYSAEKGGFHPVEICLNKHSDGAWHYSYITDFAYIGNHYPELERGLDFDFSRGEWFTHHQQGWASIKEDSAAKELYQLWEHNFLAYMAMEAYDHITVSRQ